MNIIANYTVLLMYLLFAGKHKSTSFPSVFADEIDIYS